MKLYLTTILAAATLSLFVSGTPLFAGGTTLPGGEVKRGGGSIAGEGAAPVANDRAPAQAGGGGSSGLSVLEKAQVGDVVKLQGKLVCDLGSANTGEPCPLSFTDRESGRVFQLTSETKAMKLYFDGSHDVSIDGRLVGAETLDVVDVRKR